MTRVSMSGSPASSQKLQAEKKQCSLGKAASTTGDGQERQMPFSCHAEGGPAGTEGSRAAPAGVDPSAPSSDLGATSERRLEGHQLPKVIIGDIWEDPTGFSLVSSPSFPLVLLGNP